MGPEGMLALMKWDGETPYMYFFKHGLDEEKVVSRSLTEVFFRCYDVSLPQVLTNNVDMFC